MPSLLDAMENQLKQRIKGLEKDLRLVTDLYHRAKADRDRIVSIIERICPNSICLPAKTVKDNITDYWYAEITSNDIASDQLSIDKERLSKLEITLKKSKDFRHCIHFKVGDELKAAYYISDFTLKHFGPPYDFLIKKIAKIFKDNL